MTDCAYIGRKACGCITLAVVDNPNHTKDTARSIAAAIRRGLTVERVTVEYVRLHMKKCECPVTKLTPFRPGDVKP